jgi:CRP/FNR family cyclic AMP-dependent transcriptional regulator
MQLINLLPGVEARVAFKAGQTIFKEGEPGDFMYVLLKGTVQVQVHDRVVGTFEPVEIFGEMAVIDSRPRSATLIAATDCHLSRINKGRFLLHIRSKPEFAPYIMNVLVERMRWFISSYASGASQEPTVSEKLQATIVELNTVIKTQRKEIEALQQKLSDALW